MKRPYRAGTAMIVLAVLAGAADAHPGHWRPGRHFGYHAASYGHGEGRPEECPAREWCGCWLAHRLGIGSGAGRSLWLAANWAHWGSPSALMPGAVVVYRHHVVQVISLAGAGRFLAISGNDGNAVRVRARSVAGAIAVRM